jgi:hypothetical protein
MEDYKKGLWLAVIAVCLGFYAKVFFTSAPAEPPFKPELVTCFPNPSTAGMMPAVRPMLGRERGGAQDIEDRRSIAERGIVEIREAMLSCRPDKCEIGNLKTYRSKVWGYLHDRELMTRNLYRDIGEDGLIASREIFESDGETEVIAHLRAVHAAGKIDLASFRDLRDTAALLVLKPELGYRPCQSPEEAANSIGTPATAPQPGPHQAAPLRGGWH